MNRIHKVVLSLNANEKRRLVQAGLLQIVKCTCIQVTGKLRHKTEGNIREGRQQGQGTCLK